MLDKDSSFGKTVKAMTMIGLMLASTVIIGQNLAAQNAAALEDVIASKTVSQGDNTTTTVDAVKFTAKKLTSRTLGIVMVAIVQDSNVIAEGTLSTRSLETSYTTVQVAFNSVKVTGDFDIVIMYLGSGVVNVTNITVVDQTTATTDLTAPSVSITSPASGASVSTGTRAVQGTASDNSGGSGVSTV